MKKKGLIIKILAAVLVIAIGAGIALYVADRKADYNHAEKLTVAMNTVMTQKIYSEVPGKQIVDIISLVEYLENTISFKDEESKLSKLNTEGELSDAVIAQALQACLDVSEKSGGAFDVSLGDISELWGIGTENARIPADEEIKNALSVGGYENIGLDGNRITLNGEFSVDLGAVGKGLACDYIMSYLKASEDVNGAVVSVGGSIVVYGQHNKAGDKWSIGISHPRKENEYLGIIRLDEGFVSTSGDYERYFEQDGIRYHHILDGETGYPSDSGLVSVTVVCDSGILSDALSTACFVLGKEKGEELLKQYGASGIFVDEDINITVVGDIDFEY